MLVRRAGFGIALLSALVSCGGSGDRDRASTPDDDQPTTALAIYTGVVDGTDTRVALVTENGAAALFFCGGEHSLAATKWFRSASLPLKSTGSVLEKDDWSTSIQVTAKTATGTVMMGKDAPPQRWSLTRAAEGSVAGLYDYRDELGVAGVVVENDDLAQGAYIDARPAGASPFAQIIVIRPVQVVDGVMIRVKVRDKELAVRRVRPK